MTDTTEKNDEPKPLEHKVGLHNYARVGDKAEDWIVVGAPNVRGKRWLTFAHKFGGPLISYPESTASSHFWVPNPTEK
ncbi:hypothetical protein SEA_PLATTE_73 [Microbacterium phage Platte]|nr:hypothetical protein SEA_PIONEER3_73 [Microbacterium phage Pioneer3]AWY06402.1 hypothetical protein SEA_TANDEM_73 [Microbacterium phage Tandem]QZD97665.1 hypothetical protein SEA_PLATTE_73 [Microbacterium phage Platte]